MASDLPASSRLLAEPATRRALEDFVRRRVAASDVDDIVQTVLVEALAAAERPRDEGELRRWLIGIARHKVVDHHRRASRETAGEIPDVPIAPPPLEARSLADWAEKQAGGSPDAKSTLEWMAREGEGEKLETIAEEEKVPAARVRQRVSRMRRWMKERWLAELAAAAALAVIAVVLWRLFHKSEPIAVPLPEPKPGPSLQPEQPVLERARALRDKAFEECDRASWRACLDRLDEAKGLDPAGDNDPRVGAARKRAEDALKSPAPGPTDAPTSAPTSSTPPAPTNLPGPKNAPAPKPPAPKPAPTSMDKKPPVKSSAKDDPFRGKSKKLFEK